MRLDRPDAGRYTRTTAGGPAVRPGGSTIRDLFIALLTPMARAMARVHPNTITVVSLLTGCMAGACYWLSSRNAALCFLGGALVALSGIADGLDGVVARLHGRTSAAGDFLDHFFDRIVEIAIVVGLALSPGATTTLGLGVAILVVLHSYLGTQIQASFGTRYYTGFGKAEFFIALVLISVLLGLNPEASLRIMGRELSAIDIFFAVVGVVTLQAMVHRLRLALRLASEADGRDEPHG